MRFARAESGSTGFRKGPVVLGELPGRTGGFIASCGASETLVSFGVLDDLDDGSVPCGGDSARDDWLERCASSISF